MGQLDFTVDVETIQQSAAAIDALEAAAKAETLSELGELQTTGSSSLDRALGAFGETWSAEMEGLAEENAEMADGLRLCARTYADTDDDASQSLDGVRR
ncbi:type VII secretion target [Knoellia sp. CPCC 206453]|uniref:type VII secretion target n=1 Tax=Knoellia pratensis TaxID=3404796 RepID=UPI0036179DB3